MVLYYKFFLGSILQLLLLSQELGVLVLVSGSLGNGNGISGTSYGTLEPSSDSLSLNHPTVRITEQINEAVVTKALEIAMITAQRATSEVMKSLEAIGTIAEKSGNTADGITEALNVFGQQTLDIDKWSYIPLTGKAIGNLFHVLDGLCEKLQSQMVTLPAREFEKLAGKKPAKTDQTFEERLQLERDIKKEKQPDGWDSTKTYLVNAETSIKKLGEKDGPKDLSDEQKNLPLTYTERRAAVNMAVDNLMRNNMKKKYNEVKENKLDPQEFYGHKTVVKYDDLGSGSSDYSRSMLLGGGNRNSPLFTRTIFYYRVAEQAERAWNRFPYRSLLNSCSTLFSEFEDNASSIEANCRPSDEKQASLISMRDNIAPLAESRLPPCNMDR